MKPLLLTLVLACATVGCSVAARHHVIHAGSYATILGCATADLVTTHQAFERGATEANRLTGQAGTQRLGTLVAEKAAAMTFVIVLMVELERYGHPTFARWIGYLGGAPQCAAAAYNHTVNR